MYDFNKVIKNKIGAFRATKEKHYRLFKDAAQSDRTLDADYHEEEMKMLDRVIYEMEKLETQVSTDLLKVVY